MDLHKLDNNKLIEEYRSVREAFLKSKPCSEADKEITRIYDLLVREIRKRSLQSLRLYI